MSARIAEGSFHELSVRETSHMLPRLVEIIQELLPGVEPSELPAILGKGPIPPQEPFEVPRYVGLWSDELVYELTRERFEYLYQVVMAALELPATIIEQGRLPDKSGDLHMNAGAYMVGVWVEQIASETDQAYKSILEGATMEILVGSVHGCQIGRLLTPSQQDSLRDKLTTRIVEFGHPEVIPENLVEMTILQLYAINHSLYEAGSLYNDQAEGRPPVGYYDPSTDKIFVNNDLRIRTVFPELLTSVVVAMLSTGLIERNSILLPIPEGLPSIAEFIGQSGLLREVGSKSYIELVPLIMFMIFNWVAYSTGRLLEMRDRTKQKKLTILHELTHRIQHLDTPLRREVSGVMATERESTND